MAKLLFILLIAGALVGGFNAFVKYEQRIGYDRARADYDKQAVAVDEKRAAVTPPIESKAKEAVAKVQTVTKTIIKEVPVYVKATDCPMPGGFRVLHDAAANGEVPDASRIPDAATAPAQDVAATVADNYGTCRVIRENLIGLQAWVDAQRGLQQ